MLPSIYQDLPSLCNSFGSFFVEKVDKIVSSVQSNPTPNNVVPSDVELSCPLDTMLEFVSLSSDQVSKLRKLKVSPSLDILPLHLIQGNYNTLLPVFTSIINNSLSKVMFPEILSRLL
jgi:hypothetical protein